MRNITIVLGIFLFANIQCFGQNPLFQQIKDALVAMHPDINLQDKLIAFNSWSLDDLNSRESNKAFDHAFDVYQVAKLKGGHKGLVVVTVLLDGGKATAVNTLRYDGIRMLIAVDRKALTTEVGALPSNIVFDAGGDVIYRNLMQQDIYTSIHHLITR